MDPVLPPTCGTRIPVMEPARSRAYVVAPGVAGMARRTLICGLSSHEPPTEHAAVARPLYPPQRNAVWAHWSGSTAPFFTVREGCPHSGTDADRQVCALFAGHGGLCTFAFDRTPAIDATRVDRIGEALAVLDEHARHEHEAVWRAGHDAGLLTWDELRARRIWDRLAPWDQAAVFGVVSQADVSRAGRGPNGSVEHLARDIRELTGLWAGSGPAGLPGGQEAAELWELITRLPEQWQAVVLGEQLAPHSRRTVPLDTAGRSAAAQASAGQTPPEPGAGESSKWNDMDARERGAVEATRLARLPHGWTVDGVRRAVLGRGELSAGFAAMAINLLRGYGIDVRLPHPDTP
jgi:hypothetical protein